MSTSQNRERGKCIKIALSETERATIEAKARAAGLSLSGYTRAQLCAGGSLSREGWLWLEPESNKVHI
jgi:hypothetical protein